jgi:DNA-binding GntR family transcriptional regulator
MAVGVLSEDLAEEIQRRILDGRIPLGSWLRQDALAQEFAVSRTPIREAFRALHGQGIIDMVPHRGARVRGPTPRDIRENYEVRAELEAYAAALAAERIPDQALAPLREANQMFDTLVRDYLAERLAEEDAAVTWMRANEQFHSTIVAGADNRQLTVSVHDLYRRFPRNMTFRALSGHSHLLKVNVDEHASITDAIENRDPERAQREMRSHLRRAADLVSRWFENDHWQDGKP